MVAMTEQTSEEALEESKRCLARGEFKKALHSALLAVEVAADLRERPQEAASWLAVLRARVALMMPEDALKAGEAALVISLELYDDELQANTLLAIAEAHVSAGNFSKAKKSVGIALDTFSALGKVEDMAATGKLMVEVLLGTDDVGAALRRAKDNALMLRAYEYRVLEADAELQVAQVMAATGEEEAKAKLKAKQALKMFQEEGDSSGEARALLEIAKLGLITNSLKEAEESASQAARIFRSLGDNLSVSACTDVIGALADARALKRQDEELKVEGGRLLTRLKRALQNRSEKAVEDVINEIFENGTVSQEDMDRAVAPEIEEDPEVVPRLITNATLLRKDPTKQSFSPAPPKSHWDEVFHRPQDRGIFEDKRKYYLEVRYGGIFYGPTFRQCKSYVTKRPGHPSTAGGVCTAKLNPIYFDWEPKTGYHPAIIDGAINITGLPFKNQDKARPEDLENKWEDAE